MKSAATVVLLLFAAAAPLAAQERPVTFTVWVSQTEFEGENDFGGTGFETEFDDGSALGLSANMFVAPMISVEASVFGLRSEAGLTFDQTATIALGDLDMTVFSLGAQFHPLGQRRFDPYIGAGGAYTTADDFASTDLLNAGVGRVELESGFGYYLNAGIGFQITPAFGLVVDARYMPFETESRSTVTGVTQDLEISPRILSAGLRLRF